MKSVIRALLFFGILTVSFASYPQAAHKPSSVRNFDAEMGTVTRQWRLADRDELTKMRLTSQTLK